MATYLQERKLVTTVTLGKMYRAKEKITMLTCYDASFAALMDRAGVEILLIGDSLGMVCQGRDTTLPVTIEDCAYHTACVARGNTSAMILTDMPFGTFATPASAYENAVKLMQAGAHMVKLEGGRLMAETVEFLTKRGIPVCAHVGLTPQSVHSLGGFRVQGRSDEARKTLIEDAKILEKAGASLLVLEAIPADLAEQATNEITIPTIGIGAGAGTSGQVLVMHDMLGIYPGKRPKFVRDFMEGAATIEDAVRAYVAAVKDGSFPAPEHTF